MLSPSRSEPGDHAVYVPNPYYYDKTKQHWREVYLKQITDPTSMLEALEAGQLDVADGDAGTAGSAASHGLKVYKSFGGSAWSIFPAENLRVAGPLTDVRVRQALNYAVDRKALVEVQSGHARATSEEPVTSNFDPKYANYFTYEPTKAKALLTAAGYGKGFIVTIATPDYVGPVVSHMAAILVQDFAAVGVQLNVVTNSSLAEFATRFPGFGGSSSTWTDLFLTSYGGADPLTFFSQFFLPPGGLFYQDGGHFDDPVADSIFQHALVAKAKKSDMYQKLLMDRLTQQGTLINLTDVEGFLYATKRIAGIQVGAPGFVPDITTWHPR
jgi:peptide/nickel transport system substrate-binding protein